MLSAERCTIAGITSSPIEEDVEHVFLLNLPFVSIYAKSHLAEHWGGRLDSVQFHVLTFAPEVLRMAFPFNNKQVDSRRFTIELDRPGYFSELLGRFWSRICGRTGRSVSANTIVFQPTQDTEKIASLFTAQQQYFNLMDDLTKIMRTDRF